MVHHDKCPLCSSENIKPFFSCTDHFVSSEVFSIYNCSGCGFEFTQGYPEETEIGRYYESEEYISHSNTTKGLSNKLYLLARKFMLLRKLSVIRKATGLRSGRLLDIGSGTGFFLAAIKKSGWDVKGIEINEKARTFSASKFGLDVFSPGDLSSLKTASFDCITLWHVLEHFHDPFKYASEIHRLLKPEGKAIIALPNSNSYDAKHFGAFWAAFDVPRHLWHFSPSTLREFSVKTRFRLDSVRTLPLDVFYISILSERYKGSLMPFVQGMIKGLWFSILSIFNKSKTSSLIYILHKS
jgi:SAM-dependent methyltransferase